MIARLEREAEERGYARGIADGWQAAVEALVAAQPAKPQAAGGIQRKIFALQATPKKTRATAAEVVFGVIKRAPGLTGRQIVDRCAAEGTAVEERTVRTALHRMKGKFIERKDDGGWYAMEPVGPSLPFVQRKEI